MYRQSGETCPYQFPNVNICTRYKDSCAVSNWTNPCGTSLSLLSEREVEKEIVEKRIRSFFNVGQSGTYMNSNGSSGNNKYLPCLFFFLVKAFFPALPLAIFFVRVHRNYVSAKYIKIDKTRCPEGQARVKVFFWGQRALFKRKIKGMLPGSILFAPICTLAQSVSQFLFQ